MDDKIAPLAPKLMAYDYSTYFYSQRRKNLPLILQIGFLIIGALLIIAFAFLADDEPRKADALFSPLVESLNSEKKKNYLYKLLWTDSKKVVYKEIEGNNQNLKLIDISTTLSDLITSGKRVGFIGFLDPNTLLFLEERENPNRFVVGKYFLLEKTKEDFLAFNAPPDLGLDDLDHLVSLSADRTKLAFVHESGIVIYTIDNEAEKTILENGVMSYRKPRFLNNDLLLVYQTAINSFTPAVVNSLGNITAVLPANFTNLTVWQNGFPILGLTPEGIYSFEPKKMNLLLKKEAGIKYSQPVWFGKKNIAVIAEVNGLPTILKTDAAGKKTTTLIEFTDKTVVDNLISNQDAQTIYFTAVSQKEKGLTVTFYKFGIEDSQPLAFYSVSKNF